MRQGKLEEAQRQCDEVVRAQPGNALAWQLAGVLALRRGKPEKAVAAFERSLKINARQADTLINLGAALRALDRAQDALACYDRAIALDPRIVFAHNNRANALASLGRNIEALESCERALKLQPEYAQAHNSRGNILRALGDASHALQSFDRALALMPNLAVAYVNRAAALLDLERPEEALAAADRALQLDDVDPIAWNNRGNALKASGKLTAALASYERATSLQPGYADAHANLGSVLLELRRPARALESLDRAQQLSPKDPKILVNRANVLQQLNRAAEALSTYDRALNLDPGSTHALSGRSKTLLHLARFEEAAECLNALLLIEPDSELANGLLMQCRLHVCDWADYETHASRLISAVEQGIAAIAPFWFLALSASARLQNLCARSFAQEQTPVIERDTCRPRRSHERLRIAYLSADFRDHPVARLMAGAFEAHDRDQFVVIGVSLAREEKSELANRVSQAFDRYEDASCLSDEEAAALIEDLEVDILVDLAGHTSGMRPGVLARRPASVQINYLGFPGTSGAEYHDYILADAYVIPEDAAVHYSERVVHIGGSFQANDDRRASSPGAATRLSEGLPQDALVLCSFNNPTKLTPSVFGIWADLLAAVENSVLWLYVEGAAGRRNVLKEAGKRGLDVRRIFFAARRPYAEHLARLPLADLFLDTFPFNGGSTTSDALWAGVPVLTLSGEAFASRMSGSLLRALGLMELITHSLEEYRDLGFELARDPTRLDRLRSKLADASARGALFDTRSFCRRLEVAYLDAWQRSLSTGSDSIRAGSDSAVRTES